MYSWLINFEFLNGDLVMVGVLSLTDAARGHLLNSLRDAPIGTEGIRFGLRDAGCSGFAYTFDFTKEVRDTDEVIDLGGIKFIVALDDLPVLRGTEIDLVQQGINTILQFNNPNVANTCGCGESVKFKSE